ncbi:MAG TPA: response regulator transcription factor [Gaiellales bacterium]|nr:response regulator transcription factor [Gaiellales bacterium]
MDTNERFAVIFVERARGGGHQRRDGKAILVTAEPSPDAAEIAGAIRVGTRSLVLQSSPASHLIAALRCVAAGDHYADPALASLLPQGTESPAPAQLSPRERQILGLLSEGLTGQAIARRLFLSPETVRTHVRNATAKLGAKTRVQAVALLVRNRTAFV